MHPHDLVRHPRGLVSPRAIGDPGGPTRDEAYGPGWRRTSQGMFVPAEVASAGQQLTFEVGCGLPDDAVISGRAALNFLGANLIQPAPIDVVSARNFRPASGVRRHRRPPCPGDHQRVHSIWLTRPEVALFDAIVWEEDDRVAVAIADMALASEVVDPARMSSAVEDGRRCSTRVARIMTMAEKRTRSPQETALRLIWCLDLGLPRPRCNWPVRDIHGDYLAEADLLCPELGVVGEYNGGAHGSVRRRARDAAKLQAYRRVGLEPFTVVAGDMRYLGLVERRIREAIELGDPAKARYLLERDPPWRP